MKEGAKLV